MTEPEDIARTAQAAAEQAAAEVKGQELLKNIAMGICYNMIMAMGGQIQIPVANLPKGCHWDLQIREGVAILTAGRIKPEERQLPRLVKAPASVLDQLPRTPRGLVNGR